MGLCLWGWGLGGCGPSAVTVDHPEPVSFAPARVQAQASVAAAPGFADQTGGGIFVAEEGMALRLRLDGTRAALENHPGNPVAPGRVSAVFRLGTGAALVETDRGPFLAQAGWLIAPPWRTVLGPGLRATASTSESGVWLAHDSGLYRLRDGQLSVLQVKGQPLEGLSALVEAPADKADKALWLLREGGLRVAVQTAVDTWQVRPVALSLLKDEHVVSLVGLGGSEMGAAEAWVLTSQRLLRHTGGGWRGVNLDATPTQVVAAGRFAWVKAGGALYSYDADADVWGRAENLDPGEPELLAADESGCAWARLGTQTVALSRGPVPRVLGLSEGMTVVADTLVVSARAAPGLPAPDRVSFEVGGAEVSVAGPAYSLGGVEADGTLRAYSFAGLTPGPHTLHAVARYADGGEARRSVSFDYEPLTAMTLGWARDIQPIYQERCAKCHEQAGPGRLLNSYALWRDNQALITAAVREQRMPADGPLDSQRITLIQRWAAAGANP